VEHSQMGQILAKGCTWVLMIVGFFQLTQKDYGKWSLSYMKSLVWAIPLTCYACIYMYVRVFHQPELQLALLEELYRGDGARAPV